MIRTIEHYTHHKEIRRFVRFAIVGLSGTVVDFGLLIVFKEWLGLPTILANTLSYSAGIANNFTLNRLWTYPDSREKPALMQLMQFAAVSIGGLLLNTVIVLTLETPVGRLLADRQDNKKTVRAR